MCPSTEAVKKDLMYELNTETDSTDSYIDWWMAGNDSVILLSLVSQ